MAITPRIEIKQSQSLLMTQQLRQAINLLQLNNLELSELITQELENNPILEREDDLLESSSSTNETTENYTEEDFAPDIDYNNAFNDDYGSDREGYEPSWLDHNSSNTSYTDDEFDYISQKASSSESAYELINRQIANRFNSNQEKLIASHLSTFLDGGGYFTGNLTTISQQLKIDTNKIQQVLHTLQTFEPSGIFAQTLKECLSIQLADANHLDPMMQKLLDNLELLASGDIKKLKKICQASDEDFSSMLSDIKSLNPKPLAKYNHDNNSYIIPDVFVRRNKYGEYIVELNQDTLPRVLINHNYISLFSQNKNAKKYLREKINNANFLIKSLHQRATTILKISEEIVKHQRDFFEYGITQLRPMLLRDIAEAVEMHESTISRVTNHKYMHTPIGLLELKYFFSSAAGMYNGDNQTSTTSIKHKIKQLIDNEGDKILSDDALVECLAAQSIKIARRTIAKYRDEMGIPTSAQRKREKRKIKL